MGNKQETMNYAQLSGSGVSAARGLLILEGIVQLLLGLLFLSSPGMTAVGLVQFLGFYWLIRGIIYIVQIFTKKSDISWGWLLLAGVLGVISGFLVLQHPLISTIVALRLAFYFILFTGFFQGIVSIAQGIKGEGFWSILLGVMVAIVCLYLILNPLGAGWMIAMVVGFIMLLSGISSLVFAIFFKKQ